MDGEESSTTQIKMGRKAAPHQRANQHHTKEGGEKAAPPKGAPPKRVEVGEQQHPTLHLNMKEKSVFVFATFFEKNISQCFSH